MHLRASHRERARSLDHDLVSDPDRVVGVDHAGSENRPLGDEPVDLHGPGRHFGVDPAFGAREREREDAVLWNQTNVSPARDTA